MAECLTGFLPAGWSLAGGNRFDAPRGRLSPFCTRAPKPASPPNGILFSEASSDVGEGLQGTRVVPHPFSPRRLTTHYLCLPPQAAAGIPLQPPADTKEWVKATDADQFEEQLAKTLAGAQCEHVPPVPTLSPSGSLTLPPLDPGSSISPHQDLPKGEPEIGQPPGLRLTLSDSIRSLHSTPKPGQQGVWGSIHHPRPSNHVASQPQSSQTTSK